MSLPKAVFKVLANAIINLDYFDSEDLTYQEILEQVQERTSESLEKLEELIAKFRKTLKTLTQENPPDTLEFIKDQGFQGELLEVFVDLWEEHKEALVNSLVKKKVGEWQLRGEPSWNVDVQTLGRKTETSNEPFCNLRFPVQKFQEKSFLEFSLDKEMLNSLIETLEAQLISNEDISA